MSQLLTQKVLKETMSNLTKVIQLIYTGQEEWILYREYQYEIPISLDVYEMETKRRVSYDD